MVFLPLLTVYWTESPILSRLRCLGKGPNHFKIGMTVGKLS
jgi:hypothetical protein